MKRLLGLVAVVAVTVVAVRSSWVQDDKKIAKYRDAFVRLEEARGVRVDVQKLPSHTCTVCHLGIDNPAYRVDEERTFVDPKMQTRFEDAFPTKSERTKYAKMFMAHPRLDLFVKAGSKHPLDRVDCLTCHGADDRKGELKTEKERAEWTKEYVQYHPELKTQAILLTKYVQSSCRTCHGREAEALDGAEKLARGVRVLEGSACYACHKFPEHAVLEAHVPQGPGHEVCRARRPGPPLTHVKDKLDPAWMYSFIMNPDGFRPTTRMPRFVRRPTDPAEQGPKFTPEENQVIVSSLVEYLFACSATRAYAPSPFAPSKDEDEKTKRSERGGSIFSQVGCTVCHKADDLYSDDLVKNTYDKHTREFGPNLMGIGDKLDNDAGRTWLYYWIQNPKHYFAQTRMPDLRLKDDEVRDVVEYLLSLKIDLNYRAKFNDLRGTMGVPAIPPWVLQNPAVTLDGDQAKCDESLAKVLDELVDRFKGRKEMTGKQKVLYLGEQIVGHFGCYSCHLISDPNRKPSEDWPTREPIGAPFSVSLFPGSGKFDRMPFSSVSVADSEALVTYLLSFSDMGRGNAPARPATPREQDLFRGQRLLNTYNCIGCHQIGGEKLLIHHEDRTQWCEAVVSKKDAKSIRVRWQADPETLALNPTQKAFADAVPLDLIWKRLPARGGDAILKLKEYKQSVLEIDYPHEGHLDARMPPSLRAEGSRAQASWLRSYLAKPSEIRPLLRTRKAKTKGGEEVEEFNVRMPSFQLSDEEIDALVKYFNAEAEPAPADVASRLEELKPAALLVKTSCELCHLPGANGWAPDLRSAERRLRRKWIESFTADPATHDPTVPLMPSFTGDDEKQFRAVIDVIQNYAKIREQK